MHVFFFFYTKNKDGASFAGHVIVPINGHICNLTIGLLLWVKQKRRTGLFALSSKSVMPEQEFHSD